MTADVRLLNLIDAAKVLDDPHVTEQQVKQVTQLCSILAQSIDPEGLAGCGDCGFTWESDELKAGYDLALKTIAFADSFSWPSGTDWWREYRGRMLTEWGEARRKAELAARGEVQASTLNALAAAETRTRVVADTDKPPPLLSPGDLPARFEPGDTGPKVWSI